MQPSEEESSPRQRRWFAWLTPGTGFQGKLVLCFLTLLAATLGASCWLFVSQSRESFDQMTAQHARQLSQTLAMASEPSLQRRDKDTLQRIGKELTNSRGVVAVAFFDRAGRQLAVAALDPDVERAGEQYFINPHDRHVPLNEPVNGWTSSLGRYVELTIPVRRIGTGSGGQPAGESLGYVTVCISQSQADAQSKNVTLSVMLIGAVAVLVCLPTMYLLVHHVFTPIRQLVAATQRIARGDLETGVGIDRSDVIGTLAQSFNQMVNKVRVQQTALAESNARLAMANATLEYVNQGLEAKVLERTEQLEEANARLSSEIIEKDDFLRAVSHDLNAPLRNIAGMVSMLLLKHRDTFDAEVVHRLERIQKNVEVETNLINELLELSRIKSRRQKMEPVAIGDVVAEVADLVAQDLETQQIRFTVDSEFPILMCERARMRQLFQNLVDNAIKYMGPGADPAALRLAGIPFTANVDSDNQAVREIHVGCQLDGDDLALYVRDTGIGIERADLEHVFGIFRRGKSQAVQAVAGKGVGLASVKSIVETYGGTIRVESEIGLGSTFSFTIDKLHLTTLSDQPNRPASDTGQRAA